MCHLRWTLCMCVLMGVDVLAILGVTALAAKTDRVESVPFLPKGVAIGMSVKKLQETRPNAKRFFIPIDPDPKSVDLTKGTHTFIEKMGKDSEFQTAAYVVKDGIVMAATVSRAGMLRKGRQWKQDGAPQADLQALRRKIVDECRTRFGKPDQMEVFRVNLADVVSYLAPRLCWNQGNLRIAFSCTSDYQDVEILRGFVAVTVWMHADGFDPPLHPAEVVDKGVLLRLVHPLTANHQDKRDKKAVQSFGDTVKDKKKKNVPVVIANLQSKEARTRDKAVNAILQDRKATVKHLIPMVDPAQAKRYSDETRCAAAYILGQLRAEEAVPVLSKALADPPGRKIFLRISRYDMPIFTALVRIGRPAVPAMIKNLETSDKVVLRKNSMDVLYHVLGGKQHLLELMGKLKSRAKDKAVIKRIKTDMEYAQQHYKEMGAVPLY